MHQFYTMKILRASLLIFCFFIFGLSSLSLFSKTTRSNAATGNWSSAGSWTNGVPISGDSAIIESGHAITVTSNAACTYLFLVGSNSGTSEIIVNSGQTLTVSGLLQSVTTDVGQTITFDIDGALTGTNMIALLLQRGFAGYGTWKDNFIINFNGSGTFTCSRFMPYGE